MMDFDDHHTEYAVCQFFNELFNRGIFDLLDFDISIPLISVYQVL